MFDLIAVKIFTGRYRSFRLLFRRSHDHAHT